MSTQLEELAECSTAQQAVEVGKKHEAQAKRELDKLAKESRSIAQDWMSWEVDTRAKFAKLGQRCWEFTVRSRNLLISDTQSRKMLTDDILAATGTDYAKEIGRAIKAYQLSVILGPGVLSWPTDMQKAFTTFLIEDGDRWLFDPSFEKEVLKVYRRVAKGFETEKPLTCEQVRAALKKIKSPNEPGKDGPRLPEGAEASASTVAQPEGWVSLQDPSGSPATPHHPVECMAAAQKVIASSEDRPRTLTLLGQKLAGEDMIELIGGYFSRLKQEPKQKARKELEQFQLSLLRVRQEAGFSERTKEPEPELSGGKSHTPS